LQPFSDLPSHVTAAKNVENYIVRCSQKFNEKFWQTRRKASWMPCGIN